MPSVRFDAAVVTGWAVSLRRRVLAGQPIDGLAEQVRVADMPRVLVMQIDQHPAQIRA
jgi:hypothetical protein